MTKPMRKFSSSFAVILLAAMALFAGPAAGQALNVDIVGGVKTATPIVVVPFAQAGGMPLSTDVADVMRNDFNRSGKFRSLAKSDIVEFPARGADIKFPTWRLLKQDYIVVGNIKDAGNGMVQVEYELWDVNKQQSLLHQQMPPAPAGDLRSVAHQIADLIYEKITGVRGAFWIRMASIRRWLPVRVNRCCRQSGRRTARSWPTCRSKAATPTSMCRTSLLAPANWSNRTPAESTVHRPGRQTAKSWRWHCPMSATSSCSCWIWPVARKRV
jgi:TolB-like protein